MFLAKKWCLKLVAFPNYLNLIIVKKLKIGAKRNFVIDTIPALDYVKVRIHKWVMLLFC